MRFFRMQGVALLFAVALALGFMLPTVQQAAYCQETTAGLQGTIKDPSGAVVPGATVTVTTPTLVGSKVTTTDAAGYYRFANLPPGSYTIVVKAAGFETLKQQNIGLEVGHLPTLNLDLKVGSLSTVVQVTSEAPLIDATTTTTLTNIPEETLQNIPHGTSFQSVIQFAPSARNEPLEGNNSMSNGTGGSTPGGMSNGSSYGYSIAGGSDSENSYLVEGQETANIIGGFSHTNVPIDFIQEVQLKTSGVNAEYGGALGGVVNVIMDKGTNRWHGSLFTTFQDGAMNGSPTPTLRYDPNSSGTATTWGAGYLDPDAQVYQPTRPHTSDFFPGFTAGGPIADLFPRIAGVPDSVYDMLKQHIFLFAGYNPEFNSFEQTLDYGSVAAGGGLGKVPFSQNFHSDYGYARIDAEISSKVRVYASFLTQGQREAGESFPVSDSTQGYFNVVTGCQGTGSSLSCNGNFIDPSTFSHTLGFTAPNLTLNTGADITLTNSLVSTTRFGYYFENYHDFGFPTSGDVSVWQTNGSTTTDTSGNPLPPALAQGTSYQSGPLSSNFTHFNSNKATQFDQDVAWFHAGRGGTHNVKFGYQLHRNTNLIEQGYNEPLIEYYPGISGPYSFIDPNVGGKNCAAVEAITGYSQCVGTYGVININDYGTAGTATGVNHGFYGQDAWTIGKGITITGGLRVEREYLPAENQPTTEAITKPINFGWGDKIAPRVGAAWDVFNNGKMKVFGGYGEFYDQMKLNVAISSYGGQNWEQCWFALMAPSLSGIDPAFNSGGRYCVGSTDQPTVNWGSGTQPAGITFLEGQNLRTNPTTCSTCSLTEEGTAPGLKPYAQHDSNFGVDYQVSPNVAFEARWDRRRLDHVIEDAALFNPGAGGETFVIINPGQGIDTTFNGYWNFLYGAPPDCVANTCPTNQKVIPAARSYDGLEFRVTRQASHGWMGMFSYTYSNFRGNYTGLTSSDEGDGGGGRNAPDNSRAFDEPYFSWSALGASSSGKLPTDRPNALKGYAYYDLPWAKRLVSDFGIFQAAYSGTPQTSEQDVGYAFAGQPGFPTDIVGRGKWVDISQDPTTGAVTVGSPYTKRTPWYTQTDFNFKQTVKMGESRSLAFDATFTNLLNQHSITAYYWNVDSIYTNANFLTPSGLNITDGLNFYSAAMTKYDYASLLNNGVTGGPITLSSQYGQPLRYQLARNVILGLHFTF